MGHISTNSVPNTEDPSGEVQDCLWSTSAPELKMGSQPTAETGVDKSFAKQLGRRRVFAFFWVFALIATLGIISTEIDDSVAMLDEYAIIALAVIAFVVLAYWRRGQSPAQLARANNILTALAVGLLLTAILGMVLEYGDTADFADEGGKMIISVVLLINRFV